MALFSLKTTKTIDTLKFFYPNYLAKFKLLKISYITNCTVKKASQRKREA